MLMSIPNSIEFAILALATFRLASLLANEEGPFALFVRIRHFCGEELTADGTRYSNTAIGKGVICLACNSVWIGSILTIAYVLAPVTILLTLPFALSAGAMLTSAVIERNLP